jgi:predicted tellurium resistance membrane protein TerC
MGEALVALVSLAAMEIVLGIDNVVFIAILAARLPEDRQQTARTVGLSIALITRILLLFSLSFILGLTKLVITLPEIPLLSAEARALSWRDIILAVGGLFLIAKSTVEIHNKLEEPAGHVEQLSAAKTSFAGVVTQIVMLDLVFSLDSIFTAIGMVKKDPVIPGFGELNRIWIMVAAVMIAIGVMIVSAKAVSEFIAKRPTLKILALSFLILIGVLLVAEGFDQHINKGYVYFAMAFALAVEMLNLRIRGTELRPLNNDRIPSSDRPAGQTTSQLASR